MSAIDRNYGSAFFHALAPGSVRSAERVVSYLMEVLSPVSILDVGCGVGAWVKAFKSAGATTAHGLDGPWVRESGLLIPETDFCEFDFMRSQVPFIPGGILDRYDLATSFEFVEHLPHEFASDVADFFVSKADAVVIGGAIPGQGGAHHVNEQWPSYWTQLMNERGYQACDFIRPALWDDDNIERWYRQNSIGYFKESAPDHVIARARSEWERRISSPLDMVHPRAFASTSRRAAPSFRNIWSMTTSVVRSAVERVIVRS